VEPVQPVDPEAPVGPVVPVLPVSPVGPVNPFETYPKEMLLILELVVDVRKYACSAFIPINDEVATFTPSTYHNEPVEQTTTENTVPAV
jgi:hypothetical protein